MKPTVYYKGDAFIVVGCSACVIPLNHASHLVSNGRLARTSTVVWYDEATGDFETKNTFYKKVK